MDRLHAMAVFVAVAEEGGFAAGARRLKMSAPSVTRAVADLERHLGVKLLKRTTRFVRVTESGQRYLEDCRRIIAAADEADQSAAGFSSEPRGRVALTASVLFGRLFVTRRVTDFMNRYPDVEVFALFVDRVVNLLEEGIDVAIRIGELPDSSYKAIRVGSVRKVICASPAYLSAHGIPLSPEELSRHDAIIPTSLNPSSEIRLLNKGVPQVIRPRPRLVVTFNSSAIAAAVAGLGIVNLLSYQIAPELVEGSLKIVLADHELAPLPVHVLHSEGRYAVAKVRALVDFLVEELRADPALN
ncbi:MAG: LysR family transcriptional regulator [Gammaproteobacteria bacterium]|nr:LysR family transcriptional regulator [Gammaproteobacteria bacterium]